MTERGRRLPNLVRWVAPASALLMAVGVAWGLNEGADRALQVAAGFVLAGGLAALAAALAASRQLARCAAELADRRDLFDLVVAGTNDGIWDWDLGNDRLWFSARWKEMLGYGPADLADEPATWTRILAAETAEAFFAGLKRCTGGDIPTFSAVLTCLHRDGSPRYVRCRVFVKRAASGRAIRLVGAHTDITQNELWAQELKEKTAQLERSNAELETFAYVASHDLRQPLRSVTGFIGLLDEQYGLGLPEEGQGFIRFAREGARRMDRLIVGLLEYSRIGRAEPVSEQLDLGPVARCAIDDLKLLLDEAGAVVDLPATWPLVAGREGELTRLFQNLIGNAAKYRDPSRPIRIAVAVAEDAAGWRISVSDNGIGIEPRYFDRIFGIFQRLHAAGEYEGTGIGLALCKKIVERHGGRIWLDSQPGRGATFHFTLPSVGERG
jgi:PAS domain S-box-containing protein